MTNIPIETIFVLIDAVKRIADATERIAESLEQLEDRKDLLNRPYTRGNADEVI